MDCIILLPHLLPHFYKKNQDVSTTLYKTKAALGQSQKSVSVNHYVVVKMPNKAEARRFFNYPYAAVEESLCNAVYHKGYDVREPIEVRVLPDRIE